MARIKIPGLLPDLSGNVERFTEKWPLPFTLVDPVKYITGFELKKMTNSLPPESPISLEWGRNKKDDSQDNR